jgi:hypothetical protein
LHEPLGLDVDVGVTGDQFGSSVNLSGYGTMRRRMMYSNYVRTLLILVHLAHYANINEHVQNNRLGHYFQLGNEFLDGTRFCQLRYVVLYNM